MRSIAVIVLPPNPLRVHEIIPHSPQKNKKSQTFSLTVSMPIEFIFRSLKKNKLSTKHTIYSF